MSAPSRGTHFGDGVRTGPQADSQFDNGILGALSSPTFIYDIKPEPASFTNIAAVQTPGGSGYLTLVNSGNSGSNVVTTYLGSPIVLFDSSDPNTATPRRIQFRGISSTQSVTITIQGIDDWKNKSTEQLTGPNGASTVYSQRTYKGVYSFYVSGGTTGTISAGCADAFGLPYVAQNVNYVVPYFDGIQMNVPLPLLTGTATLNAGSPPTITVSNANVKANSLIFISNKTASTPGFTSAPSANIIPGESFVINGATNGDGSQINWEIVEPSYAAGTATLTNIGENSGVIVTNPLVKSTDIIQISRNTPSGTLGTLTWNCTDGSFQIASSNSADRSSVNWRIYRPSLYEGFATLVAGTVTVPSFLVTSSSQIMLNYATGVNPGFLTPGTITDNTSFVINSSSGSDTSKVVYKIINPEPLGTYVLPDLTNPATITTGNPRGVYIPSYPSNGLSRLTFYMYNRGVINVAATPGADPSDSSFNNSDENLWGVPEYSDSNT